MTNLLYWPLIAACIYTGYTNYPLWTILVLGALATVAFALAKPNLFWMGMRERGLGYLVIMVTASSAVTALFFSAGWIVGRAIE